MNSKPVFVGIAGGTRSGKSTLCFALMDKYPDKIGILHLDDYFKKEEQIPVVNGFVNRDCPEAIDFQLLAQDLKSLKEGKTITVRTKSERLNPEYLKVGRIPADISPKPIMLVEGYLLLYDERVRTFLDTSFFLDCPIEKSLQRRTVKKMANGDEYFKKILIPGHTKYVVPTKKYAKHVIEIENKTTGQVLAETISFLQSYLQ